MGLTHSTATIWQVVLIYNLIIIRIHIDECPQEIRAPMLSDLVRKHLYAKQRDCGIQAVAKLFTSRNPSGGGGTDSLLSTDSKARLSTRGQCHRAQMLGTAETIIEGEKCRPHPAQHEGALSLHPITIRLLPKDGLLSLR